MIGEVVLTALFLLLGAGFVWMGVWGLRGRDTYSPFGVPDGTMSSPDFGPPVRGNRARWLGGGFIVLGIVAVGIAISRWV